MSLAEIEDRPDVNINECDCKNDTFSCQNIESISSCSDPRPIEIIAKLQDIYQKLLEKADEDSGEDGLRLKVATLQSWVKDLGEQNTVLVETLEQLEKEAAERVTLLEDRIRQTAQAALKYMTKLQEYDSQVQDLANQKINLVSMTLSQEQLQTRVSNLQNDVTNLVELIRRARVTGSWALDGLNFKEIISDSNLMAALAEVKHQESLSLELNGRNIQTLENETSRIEAYIWKDKALESESKVKILEECACSKENELSSLKRQLEEKDDLLKSTLSENENLYSQIEKQKKQLVLKDQEVETLKETVIDLEKSSKDERAALTAEVAEKYDEIRSLAEKNKQLENRCRDAYMQTQLKDDIIKQMRKDIKQLKMESARECNCARLTSAETKTQVADEKEVLKTSETLDAQIVEEQTRIHITHCITESALQEMNPACTAQVESLKKELAEAREEVASLKLNQKSKDQMLANQMEMFKVQQDTLNMTQTELKEMQERLIEFENMKHALQESAKELECKCAVEEAAKQALAAAEKRNEEQQITIGNLQQALLSTKHQLEELQGRGAVEVSVNSGRPWGWLQTSRSNHTTKMVVHDV